MNIPMVSAIMQSVSGEKLAIALAKQGGVSFIYGSQSVQSEADMVRRVKAYKKGFVTSDSNLPPEATLADVLDLKTRTGHSTVAITADGTPRKCRRQKRIRSVPSHTRVLKVTEFMTPLDKLVTAPANTSLHDCNDIIWDNKINSLPLVDEQGNLQYMVFRKDYDSHKEHANELLDANKSYVVGAGINTRDYAERVPALVEAGADEISEEDMLAAMTFGQEAIAAFCEKQAAFLAKVNPTPMDYTIHAADPSVAERVDAHLDEMSAALKDADKAARMQKVESSSPPSSRTTSPRRSALPGAPTSRRPSRPSKSGPCAP